MRRSKRSTEFVKMKSYASNNLDLLIALCAMALVSGCSNYSSDSTDRNNSIIVVGPDNPLIESTSSNQNTGATILNDTTSVNTSDSLQDDDGNDQQSPNTDNNTIQPLADDIDSSENLSPNVVGGLPSECLFDVSDNNVTFCYQAKTRLLRAWQNDGRQWWAFVLPGDNATNYVHALQVVNSKLYIVTELKTNDIQSGFEISVFALDGAFEKTVALDKFQDYSFVAGHRIQLAHIEDNLIIAGDYGLSTNNIMPNQFNGSFIAVFDITKDQIVNSNLYPQLRQTNPMQVSSGAIKLELEYLVYEVSPESLELTVPVSRFQSIPFSRINHHQKKRAVIGFIEKPPFEELHTQMDIAFSNTLRDQFQVDPATAADQPIDCAGGGTVQQSIVLDEHGSEVRTTTFDNCSMADFIAHGTLLQRHAQTCGQGCEGLNKTLRALAFEVNYNNGEHWSVDGYIAIKETRSSLNQVTGPIDDPETVYTNLTEINVFSMSDDQISIDLANIRYQYDGTLKHGLGTWIGSGAVSYATGITETFSVDVARQVLNGTQSSFSGQMDSSRSDGTALFVGVDTADQSRVRYTTTSAGETVQTSGTW